MTQRVKLRDGYFEARMSDHQCPRAMTMELLCGRQVAAGDSADRSHTVEAMMM